MTRLAWDSVGERFYETGVDHGVLYLPDGAGVYNQAYPWNGLTTVTESPSGAEANPQYADNIKYLNLLSAEEFGATIEAFTYPDAFAECDGTAMPSPGVMIGQQGRRLFGLAYRTLVGNDQVGTEKGHKLHLIYGAQAAPSEKAYSTINDSPEPLTFSWEVTTNPVQVTGFKPTAQMVIDSTKVTAAKLQQLDDILFGTVGDEPRLPQPDEVIAIFGAGVVNVSTKTAANQPSFNETSRVVTLPNVVGIQWTYNGEQVPAGAQPAIPAGESAEIYAVAQPGYNITGDDYWVYG
jgi:hypothetical protein